jgi:DNA-binding NarL/FixJ family response regulator
MTATPLMTTATEDTAANGAAAISVLLVDDVPEVRHVLRTVLQIDGRFRVVGEAANGAEALRLAEEQQPDVIVLDLTMNGTNGFDALPFLRGVAPDMKVLVLSAWDARADAYALGADAFLLKGERVVSRLRQLLTKLASA